MTKDGLIEQNKATGEIENISKREQDFSLRTEQPGGQDIALNKNHSENPVNQPRQDNIPHKQRQSTQKYHAANNDSTVITEPTARMRQDTAVITANTVSSADSQIQTDAVRPADENRAAPYKRESDDGGNNKSAQPSARLYEDIRNESLAETLVNDVADISNKHAPYSAEPPPEAKNAERPGRIKFTKNANRAVDGDKRHENPPAVSQHPSDNQNKLQFSRESELGTVADKPTQKGGRHQQRPVSDKSERLQFTQDNKVNAKITSKGKIQQKGNKYQQRFKQETVNTEKQPVSENRQTEQVTAIQADKPVETANNTAVESTAMLNNNPKRPRIEKPGKLSFARNKILNVKGKPRQKGNKYHQRFTPEGTTPLVIPLAVKPGDTPVREDNKSNLRTERENKAEQKTPASQPKQNDGKPEKSPASNDNKKLQTDAQASKLQDKPGKLQFSGDTQKNDVKSPGGKKKRRIINDKNNKEKLPDNKPVSADSKMRVFT